MAEYIEREALIKRLCERCNEEMSESPCEPSDCFVREVIKTIPAADVVEVVRCKDCKWGKTWKNAFGIEGFKCDLLCVDLSPEAFCSYGVRKGGQA